MATSAPRACLHLMTLLLTGALVASCSAGGGSRQSGTRTLQQRRELSSPARVDWDESWAADSNARTHYLEFIHERQTQWEGSQAAEAQKRSERAVLQEMRAWVQHQSAEHMAAAWVDYQFRHPDKYPRFRFAIEEDWRKKYEQILKNKEAGGEFERSVLATRGYEKNRALMMPPPGSEARGFIPDALVGSTTPGELVWGQPYRFVETKARQELSLSGNLEAMLRYVQRYGGHVELWVRSTKHPNGPSHLSGPLQELIEELALSARVSLNRSP